MMETSRAITRRSASNLALAFVLLPKVKRADMACLYAFCREVDDVADDTALPLAERRARLAVWREDLRVACGAGRPRLTVNRELQPVIERYQLRFELFDELLRGVEMDLDTKRYLSFSQLETYCYRVASVVGLLSIEVFGYRDAKSREYAVHLGQALQLTNILRDVKADALRDRIYLPLEEMRRCGVQPEEILKSHYTPQYYQLASVVARRARHFYQAARDTLPEVDRRSMIAAELMGAVYWGLLRRLERCGFNVFQASRIRLGLLQKGYLILRTGYRTRRGLPFPNYGAG